MIKVGYLGLGAMGGALSAHLAKAFDLTVYDRNPHAIATLVAAGAKAASSPADLARSSDIIVLCLPRTSDVKDALFSPGGLAEGLSAGKLVIDQTSGVPKATNAMATDLAKSGILMLDAPVSGGIPAALAGTVTIIASGPEKAWQAGEPVLRAMTGKVFFCSERVGDGQAQKLVNNAIGAGYRMATLELVALGRKCGTGLGPLVDRLNAGPAANFTSRNMLAGLVEGRSTTNFSLTLMVKDLNEALALGLETFVPMPMTAGARGIMQIGLNLFGKDSRLEDVIPLTEKLAHISLTGTDSTVSLHLGDGLIEHDLPALIEAATIICNMMAVLECMAMGLRFGLKMDQMARILNVGSAWSGVSEKILPALLAGKSPEIGITLAEAVSALTLVARVGAIANVPLILPNSCLEILQAGRSTFSESSDVGIMARQFGLIT